MSITYRQARPSDSQTMIRLMRLLQHDDPWSVPFEDERVHHSIQILLDDADLGIVWLICDSGRPIGYIVLCFDYSLEYGGKGAWVDEFFVEKEHRGRGIGADALRFAAEKAAEAQAHVLHLEVNRGNPAIDLYHRHGFVDHERYLMTKWLTQPSGHADPSE